MSFSTILFLLTSLSALGRSQYVLEDDYMSEGFFNQFSFFTGADPTNGFVDYQSQAASQSAGLVSSSANNVKIMVDSTNVTPNGRPSVRLTSNKAYNSGLVILDLEHMPGGICGTWPAFWMVGPNWPNGGEIDIIEGVNDQSINDMTLHTREGCSISNGNDYSGFMTTNNCFVNAAGQANNAGCQISTNNPATYGSAFNAQGGGVYATEWTSSAISVYFFPRGSIPSDITNGNPNPSSWGAPLSRFQGSCDLPSYFYQQQIVFDTTFCGDWAGNVWGNSACAAKAPTCIDFVQNNPSAFADAYWSVNALKVYQASTNASSSAPASSTPSSQPSGQSSGQSSGQASSGSAVQSSTLVQSPSSSDIPDPVSAVFENGPTAAASTPVANIPVNTAVANIPAIVTTPVANIPATVTTPVANIPVNTPVANIPVPANTAAASTLNNQPENVTGTLSGPAEEEDGPGNPVEVEFLPPRRLSRHLHRHQRRSVTHW